MYRITDSVRKEAQELANKINSLNYWDMDLNYEFCKLAGLEEEWFAADGDNFEAVIWKAEDILGVILN